MPSNQPPYEAWLTTLANTRLIYNTLDELETVLDNHSIHNNGIKRCFTTPQKLRAAFRDLDGEVEQMTGGFFGLAQILDDYQHAWAFYRSHLRRRSNPQQVALELLCYCYPPYHQEGMDRSRSALYQQVVEQQVNVPFLVMLLLKAIPGYDSKEGDAVDMPARFEQVMLLMEQFTGGRTLFHLLPAITRAREETDKSRLMLFYHVSQILDTYESYTSSANLYDTALDMKDNRCPLDIAGYWNECDGTLLYTDFWQIEDALDAGTYFLTHWHKDADQRLSGVRYTLFVLTGADGGLIYYMLHPEAIRHRMQGQAYVDADHVWYQTGALSVRPDHLPLERLLYSEVWPQKIGLTRCTDDVVVAQYDRWLHHDCDVVKPYGALEYDFHPCIYAVTLSHIYILSEHDGEYYRAPRTAHEGFDCIQLSDNVGLMFMNGTTYLAFDELMLYIATTPDELQRYGIERVSSIE